MLRGGSFLKKYAAYWERGPQMNENLSFSWVETPFEVGPGATSFSCPP